MTVTAALLIYAAATALLAPVAIGRATWLSRSPRLGVLAWQAAVAAVLGALVLLIVTAAVPVNQLSLDVNHLLHACAVGFSEAYRSGDTGVGRLVAAGLGALGAGRLMWVLTLQLADVRRQRREQRMLLALLAGSPSPDGAIRLQTAESAAYSVPGEGGRIVITSGAEQRLDAKQVTAVIAHERAHLRERHDLVLLGSGVAAASFSWLPFFRKAHARTSAFVEMVADDLALRTSGRTSVAAALVSLCEPRVSPPAGTSGTQASERVARLMDPTGPSPSRARQGTAFTVAAALAAGPWLLALAPVWAAYSGLCQAT